MTRFGTVRTRCESKDFGDIEVAMAPYIQIYRRKLKESLFLRGTLTTYKSKRRNTNPLP